MPSKKKIETKPVAKVATSKKPVAKNVVVKKAAPTRRTIASNVVQKTAPSVAHPVHGKTVTHHRVVLYETCTNCQHMPDSIGSILGVLSVLAVVLSGMVLSLAPIPDDWQNLLVHQSAPSVIDQTIAQK